MTIFEKVRFVTLITIGCLLTFVSHAATSNSVRTIEVKEAGTLSSFISESDKYKITDLTISGRLNGTDLRLLRVMAGSDHNRKPTAGKLEYLDLRDVIFMDGGQWYVDAFGGKEYTTINYNLPRYAFAYCESLKYLYLPKAATEMALGSLLWMTSLIHVEIPATMSTIYDDNISYCKNMTTLTLPSSVQTIKTSFNQCKSLSTVYCYASEPPTLTLDGFKGTNIENGTLYVPKGCSNKYWRAEGWNEFGNIVEMNEIYHTIWICPATTGGTITYKKQKIRKRGDDIFWDGYCGYDVKEGVNISLYIEPDNGYQIDKVTVRAEDVTSNIKNNTLEIANITGITYIYVHFKKDTNVIVDGLKYKIENGKATLTDGKNVSGKVVIPSQISHNGSEYPVTKIGSMAFYDCTDLTAVEIPSSTTTIGAYSFDGCSNLATVKIANGITSIETYAFRATDITSIDIPNSVTSIGNNPFSDCDKLETINVDKGNKVYDSRGNCNAIIETSSNTLVSGCKSTIIPNSVTKIGYTAFQGCRSLKSIVIPNNVELIDQRAFCYCESLESIVIPGSVSKIVSASFWYCI